MYQVMEDSGLMKCFGLYDGPRVVGFASVLTSVLPHYGKLVATVESIFVDAEYRGGFGSAQLIRAIEAFAGASGCVVILYSAPAGGALEDSFGGRPEYERTNSVFCRRLP
jgi:GNAT superfamily N-acetyltransferase